jgi:predicted DNA-binding transcriptional regulator YafY
MFGIMYFIGIYVRILRAISLEKELNKYIGRIVEIIYQGSGRQITQRRIEIRSITGGIIKAYCLQRQAPRLFRIENILALQPLHQGARAS